MGKVSDNWRDGGLDRAACEVIAELEARIAELEAQAVPDGLVEMCWESGGLDRAVLKRQDGWWFDIGNAGRLVGTLKEAMDAAKWEAASGSD